MVRRMVDMPEPLSQTKPKHSPSAKSIFLADFKNVLGLLNSLTSMSRTTVGTVRISTRCFFAIFLTMESTLTKGILLAYFLAIASRNFSSAIIGRYFSMSSSLPMNFSLSSSHLA